MMIVNLRVTRGDRGYERAIARRQGYEQDRSLSGKGPAWRKYEKNEMCDLSSVWNFGSDDQALVWLTGDTE